MTDYSENTEPFRKRRNRCSENLGHVLKQAREEAIRFDQDFIVMEHLLLALVKNTDNNAVTILESLYLDMGVIIQSIEEATCHSIEEMMRKVEEAIETETVTVSFTIRAQQSLEIAAQKAQEMKSEFVYTEHLLLALILADPSQIFSNMGVCYESVEKEYWELRKKGEI